MRCLILWITPIQVDEEEFEMIRDAFYEKLKEYNVF